MKPFSDLDNMALEQKLIHRLETILTPQLLLNLRLLALPTLELQTLIRAELERNPVLEEIGEEAEEETTEETASTQEKQDDFSPDDFFQEDIIYPVNAAQQIDKSEEEFDPFDTVCSAEVRLVEVLLPILKTLLTPEDLPIGEYIINNLDEDGFLITPKDEIINNFSISEERLNRILSIIQNIEPGGIATRDTKEALLVQLKKIGLQNSLEYKIINDYYHEMCNKQFPKISKELGVKENKVREAVMNICQLETRPARQFCGTAVTYITPDFIIEWRDDKLIFNLYEESFPQLRLSKEYREILKHPKGFPKEQVQFAREKFKNAVMLLRALESRKRTLNKVMEYILKEQQEFFTKGREFLKPSSIRDAALSFGMHPSTVSRAIQGKYVEAPMGIFPLRFFFSSGSEGKARYSIKERIREIIKNEDKKVPYSDEEIALKLKEEGINIARRTVSKYRQEMKILGCNDRRE